MPIKIIVTLFVIFALTRVYLRYKDGSISNGALFIWGLLWLGIEVFIWWPKVSDTVAHSVGLGRGADALVYFSIVALFYGVFRLYVKMEFIEHEITSLVRQLAIGRNEIDQKAAHQTSSNNDRMSA